MTDYTLLNSQYLALVDGETDALANASNFVGLLFNAIDNINRIDNITFGFRHLLTRGI
jgi:putative methionine-R-sulfoxide reductase with GAF domain